MRNKSIDVLKLICAFLIVCIHIPPEIGGGYSVALCRIGVPIFLMISGYFYRKEKAIGQIKKIGTLFIEANLLYVAWSLLYGPVSGNYPAVGIKAVLKFIFLNVSPFGGHLWYLGAILYVLIVVYVVDKTGVRRTLYYLTPLLLLTDLVLGKYSLLIFGREFPYILVRNWLFTGIPFFALGMLMREKKGFRIPAWGIPLFAVTTILERYLLVSNDLNATRDQYLSTAFLAVAVFSFALDYKGKVSKEIARLGQECSTWIYVIHPIFITCYRFVTRRIGLESIWDYTGTVVVFIINLIFVKIVNEGKKRITFARR